MSEFANPTQGLPMFEAPKARKTDPGTSKEAAASMATVAESQRQKILDTLRTRGPQTADSLDFLIRWRPTTAGRRLKELSEAGLVEMTGVKSRTRSGRKAYVWKLIQPR